MKFTIWDVMGCFFNGLIMGLLIWFMHSTYAYATQMGYTPQARAHMDELVAAYQEPDYDAIPRLSVNDLND